MSVTVLSQQFVKQADKKKKRITTHAHKKHTAKIKPYNSQAYKKKKKKRHEKNKILVNVRSPIMLNFVPPS